jgi:hypothetical protein
MDYECDQQELSGKATPWDSAYTDSERYNKIIDATNNVTLVE